MDSCTKALGVLLWAGRRDEGSDGNEFFDLKDDVFANHSMATRARVRTSPRNGMFECSRLNEKGC